MFENDVFDWEDEIVDEGKDYVLLPEGDYEFTVSKFERARYDGSEKIPPCNNAKVTLKITGEEGEIEITENLFLCKKFEWKLSSFFLSIGQKKHGEPLRMNWNNVVGAKGRCHVYVDKYTKKDGSSGESNKIKKYYAYDEEVNTVKPVKPKDNFSNGFGGFNSNSGKGGFGNWNGGSFK